MEVPSPHSPRDVASIPDVGAFGQGLVQRHAQQVHAIVERADEEVHLIPSIPINVVCFSKH